jgi:hypothetical protein
MEELCANLLKTYNTNVLNNAPIEIKEAFYNESKRSPECIKGREVLKTLIQNHFEKQKPKPKFIGGPKTLSVHWSEEYQKMIYIFGEHHSNDMHCDERFGKKAKKEEWGRNKMSVEDFFFELISTTDVFIDFFFEFPAYSKGLNKYTVNKIANNPELRMQKLFDYFKKCADYPTRSDLLCRLARIHYFDIRKEDKNQKLKQVGLFDLFKYDVYYIMNKNRKNTLECAQKFRDLLDKNQTYRIIIKNLIEEDDKIFLDFCMTFFIGTNSFIGKELDKVNLVMKDLILAFIRKEFLERTKQLRKIWHHNVPIILKYYENEKEKEKETIKEKHKDTHKAFVLAMKNIVPDKTMIPMALLADTYALARIFKNFDMRDMEKAYTGATDQPSNAHNIIIYAGDFHSETYRKFLDSINFKQIARSGISSFENITCLNMKKIPQPFFSV